MALPLPSLWAVWFRRSLVALAIAILLGWLPYRAYRRTGLARLMKLRAEVATLHAENGLLRVANTRLRAELGLYEEDPAAATERAAREELGLFRPGEVVFKIKEAPVAEAGGR